MGSRWAVQALRWRRIHVCVTPAGGRLWRLRYDFNREEKLLSIGPYPSVGVAEPGEAATSAKRLLREARTPLSRSGSSACQRMRLMSSRRCASSPDGHDISWADLIIIDQMLIDENLSRWPALRTETTARI
jgi:Arm DNA-binding domain